MWFFKLHYWVFLRFSHRVSILVLMDVVLQVIIIGLGEDHNYVSILVLMDVVLQD